MAKTTTKTKVAKVAKVPALRQSTGRRKSSVARVRIRPGKGVITCNGREFEDYFPFEVHRMIASEPLRATNTDHVYDIDVTLHGGGIAGQAGALRHAISRAIALLDDETRPTLKRAGFLTRDPREKERKKYGLKKARKSPQFSKR